MRSAPFLEIIDRLESLNVDDGARQTFHRLLLEIGTRHGISGLAHYEQMIFVRKLLGLRVSRPTIRDRLMALYGISRRQAYRLIGQALQLKLCPRGADLGTHEGDYDRAR
jgi:hypothetical protein